MPTRSMPDEVVEELRSPDVLLAYAEANLEPRGHGTYVCPCCGSGDGPNHTAALKVFGTGTWHCFSCNSGGDVFDLYQAVTGAKGFRNALFGVAVAVGVYDGEALAPLPAERRPNVRRVFVPKVDAAHVRENREREAEIVAAWRDAYPGSPGERYAEQRGIAGYPCDYGWDARRRRLVIPWPKVDWYHIDRDITGTHPHKYEKPRADVVGKQPILSSGIGNLSHMVVVEGAVDAYALMSVGVVGIVALCGTGNDRVTNAIRKSGWEGTVVCMLDNDRPGRDGTERLRRSLAKASCSVVTFPWTEDDPKDVDECVQAGLGRDVAERVMSLVTRTQAPPAEVYPSYNGIAI